MGEESSTFAEVLDLTVCCRSNDAIWGAHGANVVHLSVLQEYLAAHIGVGVGKLCQLSNNYHVYLDQLEKVWPMGTSGTDFYRNPVAAYPIVTAPNAFELDLSLFFSGTWEYGFYENEFFRRVAVPMRKAYQLWRMEDLEGAFTTLFSAVMCDWTIAAVGWLHRARARKSANVI